MLIFSSMSVFSMARQNSSNEILPYKSRLEHLKIEPLFLRRRKTDILTAFKLLLNVFDFPHLQTHLVLRGSVTSRPCRPHRFVLKKRRLIYKDSNWYFSRIVNLINSLPPELNDCSTIEDVVSVLTTHLFTTHSHLNSIVIYKYFVFVFGPLLVRDVVEALRLRITN